MKNNLKTIIKILSTSYLLLAVLFPYFPSYWHHESWVYKTRNFVHDMEKQGQNPITVSQQQLDL